MSCHRLKFLCWCPERTRGYSLRFPGYQVKLVIDFEASSIEGVDFTPGGGGYSLISAI